MQISFTGLARPLSIPVLLLALAGCGAGTIPAPEGNTGNEVAPVGQSIAESGPEVEIWTSAERIVVQGFRVDFPKMRNVHNVVGFVPEQWDTPINVPMSDVRELQIRSVLDQATFDKIFKYREQYSVNPQEFFNVEIQFLDGRRLDMVAIFPRFRGLKDGIVWEMSMAGNPARIDRIVVVR